MSKRYRLVGRDGAEYLSPAKGLVGGNRRSKIYGRLDCPSALRAIAKGDTYQKHRVFFADAATVVAAGLVIGPVGLASARNTNRGAPGFAALAMTKFRHPELAAQRPSKGDGPRFPSSILRGSLCSHLGMTVDKHCHCEEQKRRSNPVRRIGTGLLRYRSQ
jgi:hypothetical protein